MMMVRMSQIISNSLGFWVHSPRNNWSFIISIHLVASGHSMVEFISMSSSCKISSQFHTDQDLFNFSPSSFFSIQFCLQQNYKTFPFYKYHVQQVICQTQNNKSPTVIDQSKMHLNVTKSMPDARLSENYILLKTFFL